jgi:diguanylate cyclase (GGDEF)-like protein
VILSRYIKADGPGGIFCLFTYALVLTIFLLRPDHLYSLDPHRLITQYTSSLLTTEDGLPQNTIQAILQTSDGYIWAGTQEGLARFNGISFIEFTKDTTPGIKSDYFYTLFEDNEECLWMGTRGGVTRYKDGKFYTFTKEDGLWDNIVLSVCSGKDGSLWIGTLFGLNKMVNGQIERIPWSANIKIGTLFKNSRDTMWFGTDHGLFVWEEHTFKNYTTKDGLSSNLIEAICEDHQQNIWIATLDSGLNKFSNGEFSVYTKENGLPDNSLRSLCVDKDNNLWIGTIGSGVVRKTENDMDILNSENGLSNDFPGVIYEDREGCIWIGTEKGINRLYDGNLTVWTKKQGLSENFVSCVIEDSKQNLWVGTYTGGLNLIKIEDLFSLKKVEGLHSEKISSIWEDSLANIWVGTRGDGLIKLNIFNPSKSDIFTTKEGLSHNTVWAIFEDNEKNLWIGTKKGLNKFAENGFTVYGINDGMSNENIYAITSDKKGRLLIGTSGGGLNVMEAGKFMVYSTEDGLSDNVILAIYEDTEGILWIGTAYGLNRIENDNITAITKKSGLFDNVVFQILEDQNGDFWMSSNRGISRVKKEELNQFSKGEISRINAINYGIEDGMKNVECNGGFQPAGWKSSDGKLFFPTVEGFVMIDPGKIKNNLSPPPILIERLIVNGNPVEIGKNMELVPGVDKLEIHYTALSYVSAKKIKFKYKLDNYDTKWEEVDKFRERIAHYGHLPPGSYMFRINGCNSNGVWNDNDITMSFKVLPFFWEAWWFKILLIAAAIGLIYGIFLIRLHDIRKQRDLLEKEVARQTKVLRLQKEELEQQKNNLEKLTKKLNRMARTDPLTKLFNRRAFIEKMSEVRIHQERSGKPFVLVLGDIDKFKTFNDEFGHDCGDAILSVIAKIIKDNVRRQDVVGRWGGEEFIILLPQTSLQGGTALAEKLRRIIAANPYTYKGKNHRLTITFGLSECTLTKELKTCIKEADDALYVGKRKGRNCVVPTGSV